MAEGKASESKRRIAWGRYLLLFFVAAWMFVLGLLVGRGTAPLEIDTQALQKELTALRDAMLKKQREAVEKAIRGDNDKDPLDFYEALKKDGPDTTVQIPAATAAAAAYSKEAEPVRNPPHKSRSVGMTKKDVAAHQPASMGALAANQKATPVEGRLTIQIASLKDAAAAEQIVAKLKKDGYPAYLSSVVVPDQGTWFRVRIGSYENREAAAADMDRLVGDRQKPILMHR